MCPATAKEIFPSRAAAEVIARKLRYKRHVPIDPFLCEWCGHWHIGGRRAGSKRKKFDRKRMKRVVLP